MRSSSQFRQIRAFGSSWSFQSACVVLQIKLVLRWPWWLTVFGVFFPGLVALVGWPSCRSTCQTLRRPALAMTSPKLMDGF